MVLNLHPAIAADLLGAIKRLIVDYKKLEQELGDGRAFETVKSRRRSLQIVRHRLEFGLGLPNPYTDPANVEHLEDMKLLWRQRKGE